MVTWLLTAYLYCLPAGAMAPAPATPGGTAIPGSPTPGVVLEVENWDYINMRERALCWTMEVK
jgi:hypothetical protein